MTLDTSMQTCLPSAAVPCLTLISLILYCVFSFYQSESHYILYTMKRQATASQSHTVYSLPTESLFQYISCPHYTAEICIYLSFCCLLPCNGAIWLMAVWVVLNLSVVANRQFVWYKEKYKDQVPANWCRLCPNIW